MARIIRCDKCEHETTNDDDVIHIEFDAGNVGYGVLRYDLCKPCTRQLHEYLKSGPKEGRRN